MNIFQISTHGNLSRYLHQELKSHIVQLDEQKASDSISALDQSCLILTLSRTLHLDTAAAFDAETNVYKRLLSNIARSTHIIYISSQTLELTNQTYYSRAKQEVERLITSSRNPYTIIRPGMIFDSTHDIFFLESMDQAAKSLLTFHNDLPKTTICTARDIALLIKDITNSPRRYTNQILNLGLKRFTFSQIQSFQKHSRRLPVLTFGLLSLFSYFTPRLRAYCLGEALSEAPPMAIPSSFDGDLA